jgi:hypothetical protein
VNPPSITVSVLDMQPLAFAIQDLEGHSAFDGEYDVIFGFRTLAEVALRFIGNNGLDFSG